MTMVVSKRHFYQPPMKVGGSFEAQQHVTLTHYETRADFAPVIFSTLAPGPIGV